MTLLKCGLVRAVTFMTTAYGIPRTELNLAFAILEADTVALVVALSGLIQR